MTGIKLAGSHDEGGWLKLEGVRKASVVQDAKVTGYDLVLEHGAGWNIDPIAVVGDDDDGSLE